jgi:hypothetical protein
MWIELMRPVLSVDTLAIALDQLYAVY